MTSALGITVAPQLLDRWRAAFAPPVQPFRTDRLDSEASDLGRLREPSPDVRDTFQMYGGSWTWLEEAEFLALSLPVRRRLLFRRAALGRLGQVPVPASGTAEIKHTDSRIVWWPSLLRRVGDEPLLRYVENGLPPSRHREVTSAGWARASEVLPEAAELAGRFPDGSGPNCFSSVLAAAGVEQAKSRWMPREPFEEWLAERCTPVRGTKRDTCPGVVLVWRNGEGLVEHAAVTIGGGYVLNKPSQGWFSPYVVWTVPETVAASRYRGVTLSRYLMVELRG